MLEVNNVAQEPSCFFSKLSRLDGALLGVPLVYTTNPVTQSLDYVSSAFDILSWSSFQMDGCKRSAWGDKCTAFLPLYLDKQHYQQGIPILKSMAKKLTNFTEGARFKENHNPRHDKRHHATMKVSTVSEPEVLRCEEDCVIKLLVSMMNTQVVLLSDKGISASEDSLNRYCQLHRILLEFVNTNLQARAIVRRRLDDFVKNPTNRVKSAVRSLGELIPLLSVSDTYSWRDLCTAYFDESLDRSVLWACTRDPSLAQVQKGDMSRLERHLASAMIGTRLMMFHAVFLKLLTQTEDGRTLPAIHIADRYDTFLGRPPVYIQRKWRQSVAEIFEANDWESVLRIAGIPLLTPQEMLRKLECAVENALVKGYHSKSTDFSKVHKSGVSKILLKGKAF